MEPVAPRPEETHGHQPVLAEAVLEHLAPRPGDVAVDLTAGRGGHATLFADRVGPTGRIVAFDLDPANLAYAEERVRPTGVPFTAHHANFAEIASILARSNVRADVVLADLGYASIHVDDVSRGFSFREDAPLDMRYDTTRGPTAASVLATWPEADLGDLIERVGEEPLGRRIARNLVQARAWKPIETTSELVEIVLAAYGGRARTSRRHPATRTFMALRIAVNEELESLTMLLESIEHGARTAPQGGWLQTGARVGIISFHSLEDRLVKQAFREITRAGLAGTSTKRPVIADAQEVRINPRARSAKLRALCIAEGPQGVAVH